MKTKRPTWPPQPTTSKQCPLVLIVTDDAGREYAERALYVPGSLPTARYAWCGQEWALTTAGELRVAEDMRRAA